MNRRLAGRRFGSFALLLLALLLIPVNIFPCGGGFPEPVFTQQNWPDQPLDRFAQGRLGIVLPTYERQYLVVAYRYLAAKPLTKEEETAVAQAWSPKVIPPGTPWPGNVPADDWQRARRIALGSASPGKPITASDIELYRRWHQGWEQYRNCGDDALFTAAQTAENLAKTFGAGSEVVRDWLQGQDTVFRNCGPTTGWQVTPEHATELHPYIPAPATIDNAVLKMNRQYQIAAANFYAGDFQTAAHLFQQIAAEPDSPWHIWAPYLVARCYIREATLSAPGDANSGATASNQPSFDVQQMTAAETQLQSILKDPALSGIHPAAQKLLNYVEARLHPDQRLHQVAQQLAGNGSPGDITQDMIDFNWFIRQQAIYGRINSPEFTDWRDDLAKRGLLDDLTDWVVTFQQESPAALEHAVERWRATKSEAWLMAALSKTTGNDSNTKALAEAAAAVPQTSPAYEMAVYERSRLLVEQKQSQAARQLLDANLSHFEKGSLSSYNLLLGLRFAVAANYHEFLEYAPRTPAEWAYTDCDDCGSPPETGQHSKPSAKRLDGDSAGVFNQRLPLSILTKAATEPVMPSELREHIATATWTRAAILGDTNAAKSVETPMADAHPEVGDYLKTYDSAVSDDARSFAATWMMLHFPGMDPFIHGGAFRDTKFAAIDDFRANWWCGKQFPSTTLPPGTVFYGNGPGIDPATGKQVVSVPVVPPPAPSFLSTAERTSGDEQRHKLSMLPSGPVYMGRVVLDWAKTHPDDQRLPEALHLVVRATRYGCTDDKMGAVSKQAFDLLHARYPTSNWAKQTPYWFK